jgi:hypothetical protein
MRNMRMSAVMMVLAVVFASGALGADAGKPAATLPYGKTVVDVGNKICPVTGRPVDGKTFYKYNSRRYGFCCKECIETFIGDLEKYSAIAERKVAGKK